MHARSRDSNIISLIYVCVKVAHSWKLKAGFRACSLPQSSACWMWPPFWLDVWSPVRVCVYMRPGCFSACQQLKWYMAEAAFLPPSECQPAMHVHAMQEPDTLNTRRSFAKIILATYWSSAASRRLKNKTKSFAASIFFLLFVKDFFSILNCVYMQWINFEIFWLLNELTLKRTNFWHSLLFSNKQDLSYCRIKVIPVLPLTRQMICFVSPLQEMTC